ncbi:MAG TPA: FAD/NAD(P)-binding protein [Allosphingosinicella sp.]
MSRARVAVIGGGLSGSLQAIHLLRDGAQRVTLIERARTPGRGVAYSTARPEHVLNVPARRMSAFPDAPDHFVRWYEKRGGDAESFAPRMLFGDYVVELLAAAGAGLDIVRGDAVDIDGAAVILGDGRRIEADAVVLAPGNLQPATPRGIDPAALGRLWVADPWAAPIADGLGGDDIVLLLGTGLTAVDAALTLEANGFRGRMIALSRRGLAPRSHAPREPICAPQGPLPSNCLTLLRRLRSRSAEIGWRSAVHELRTVTQDIWAHADEKERRRFLRHLRPWWDVHRHKIAPAVGAAIECMVREGRLRVVAGRVLSISSGGMATWRPRGSTVAETVQVARIVNCTGPECDIVRAGEPLFDALLARGRIRPDPLRLGIHVDEGCRTLGADGPSDDLYAIGPVTRGTFWESVAVPDIRVQAQNVARRILA